MSRFTIWKILRYFLVCVCVCLCVLEGFVAVRKYYYPTFLETEPNCKNSERSVRIMHLNYD